MSNILKRKKSKNDIKVLELPNNNIDMESYVLNNKEKIYDSIISNIETAIKKRLGAVEVFRFQETNFVVVINRKDFKENLQNAFDFSLENEHFEICAKAKNIMNKLEKISFISKYKINPKTPNVKTETPAEKTNKTRNSNTRKKRGDRQ